MIDSNGIGSFKEDGVHFETTLRPGPKRNNYNLFAAWKVLMTVRIALDCTEGGDALCINDLKYSPSIFEFIRLYEEADVLALAELMPISDEEKVILIDQKLKERKQPVNLRDDQGRYDVWRGYEKRGALRRPKLKGRYHILGCNVRGGRGVPLVSGAMFISYRHRGRRYRLTASEGKVVSSNRTDLIEDLNPGRILNRVEMGAEGIAMEKRDAEHAEGVLFDSIINALLYGKHGPRVARWIWALMLFGTIAIDSESTKRSYVFGPDLDINDEHGYKIRLFMTSKCLTTAVMYTDKDRLWIDVMDNLELREVTSKCSNRVLEITDEITTLKQLDTDKLVECSITSKLGIARCG